MSENMKKIAISGSAITLAIAMGLQTFVFGTNDMQTLKEEVQNLSARITKLETPIAHE